VAHDVHEGIEVQLLDRATVPKNLMVVAAPIGVFLRFKAWFAELGTNHPVDRGVKECRGHRVRVEHIPLHPIGLNDPREPPP